MVGLHRSCGVEVHMLINMWLFYLSQVLSSFKNPIYSEVNALVDIPEFSCHLGCWPSLRDRNCQLIPVSFPFLPSDSVWGWQHRLLLGLCPALRPFPEPKIWTGPGHNFPRKLALQTAQGKSRNTVILLKGDLLHVCKQGSFLQSQLICVQERQLSKANGLWVKGSSVGTLHRNPDNPCLPIEFSFSFILSSFQVHNILKRISQAGPNLTPHC